VDSWEKAQYSINKGLGNVGGKETLTSHLPLPDGKHRRNDFKKIGRKTKCL
jgi:hypothetical protein